MDLKEQEQKTILEKENITILAVDDEPSLLRIIEDILETGDMMMIPAMTAEEAYRQLETGVRPSCAPQARPDRAQCKPWAFSCLRKT